jgi:hypothetical protein
MAIGWFCRSTVSLALLLLSGSSALSSETPQHEQACKPQSIIDMKVSPDGKYLVGFTGKRAAPYLEEPDDDDSGPPCFVWAVSAAFLPKLQ